MRSDLTVSRRVRELATRHPDASAYVTRNAKVSWREYSRRADDLASELLARGIVAGDRVAVLLPDGPGVHVSFLAVERAGAVIVGAGARSGVRELEHLLGLTQANALITDVTHQGEDIAVLLRTLQDAGVGLESHVMVDGETGLVRSASNSTADRSSVDRKPEGRNAGEAYLLNSTSGTTGMPKCVVHDQLRWFAFHEFALEAGRLDRSDVFMSVVPAPFGFGIWTAHVTPTLLGVPTVLMTGFDADGALELIERERVTVLAAVSTQFIMMLGSEAIERADLSSLRVLFTGGEAVPKERAAAFEEKTGARVLQFYGSNEVGAVSRTTLEDGRDRRLGTAGRVIDEMNVRLFDDAGNDVTRTGRGQPGCKGPTLSLGYHRDDEANATLVREDGWMMLGDIVTIDEDGYLTVVGRTDDFVIRGGKNISAVAVEEQVAGHPSVAHVGVVAMPDPVFGERVCAVVELHKGMRLALSELCEDLAARGTSKEYLPERLVVLESLPRAAGGKIAKGELRAHVRALAENATENS